MTGTKWRHVRVNAKYKQNKITKLLYNNILKKKVYTISKLIYYVHNIFNIYDVFLYSIIILEYYYQRYKKIIINCHFTSKFIFKQIKICVSIYIGRVG